MNAEALLRAGLDADLAPPDETEPRELMRRHQRERLADWLGADAEESVAYFELSSTTASSHAGTM